MKKRADGRWRKTKTINGKRIPFYSSETTERKAMQDIENQMLAYTEKLYRESHNFKILAEKALDYKESAVEYNTDKCYRTALKHLRRFYEKDIDTITASDLDELLSDMKEKKYSFSTVAKVKITFGLVLNYAIVKEKLNIPDISKTVKLPRNLPKGKVKSPPDFVIDTIFAKANDTEFGLWPLTLICTGFRRGELNGLMRKDVDFGKGIIRLTHSTAFVPNKPLLKETKSEAGERDTPILDVFLPYLKELCKNKKPEEFLFGGSEPFTKSMIRKRWDKYCKSIGYTFKQHQLRHAYARLLYRAGVDPKTMQQLLGHADFGTTMNIYTEFENEVPEKTVSAINNYMNSTYEKP